MLVTVHGSGSNNVLFMQEGSTLVEVRPYEFGTKSPEWANFFIPEVTRDAFDCCESFTCSGLMYPSSQRLAVQLDSMSIISILNKQRQGSLNRSSCPFLKLLFYPVGLIGSWQIQRLDLKSGAHRVSI